MRRIAAACVLVILLANPSDISSCGPFIPGAIFTRSQGPDSDRAFFAGHLGILQPTYERRYLAMAYRMLNDEPLNDAQRAEVTDLERYRYADVQGASKEWLAARTNVRTAEPLPDFQVLRQGSFYWSADCGVDAFMTARKTLLARIQQAGANGTEVRDWLHAQDVVFQNCAGGATIPDAASKGSSARVLADRAYQIAAAYFYARRFDEARAQWMAVAGDKLSPWHVLAPYLIARCYLREEKYKEAETQLQAVLSDKAAVSIQHQARNLLDYALARIDPAAQLLALSKRLMLPSSKDLGHDLNDYTFLFDRFDEGFSSEMAPGQTESQMQDAITQRWDRLRAVAAQSDLTTWILEFQGKLAIKHDEAQRWRRTKSVAWLIAAWNQVKLDTPDGRDLLAALRAIPASSPGYATARFAGADMLTEANRTGEAIDLLDEVLNDPGKTAGLDASTLNAFHAERMRVARTLEEFLAHAPRALPYVADEGNYPDPGVLTKYEFHMPLRAPEPKHEPAQSFDADAAYVFDFDLPLSVWMKAVKTTSLAAGLRSELAQAGWVRAIVVSQPSAGFAGELASLKPAYAPALAAIARLTGDEQRFSAVFWMLRHAELSPHIRDGLPRRTPDGRMDEYRDNWWCGSKHVGDAWGSRVSASPILRQIYAGAAARPRASFHTAEERAESAEQQAKMEAAGDAATLMASMVVDWAQRHPHDARNAEALALVVKASHFSCRDPGRRNEVERAFRLLHDRYPKSKWADSTPYWYD